MSMMEANIKENKNVKSQRLLTVDLFVFPCKKLNRYSVILVCPRGFVDKL